MHSPPVVPWPNADGRPLLGANGTEAMNALLAADDPAIRPGGIVDFMKVGPFMGRPSVSALGRHHPLLLHLDDPLSGHQPLLGDAVARIKEWIALTATPWTSAHIGFSVADVSFDEAYITQPVSRLLARDCALGNITRNARDLAARLPVPLLLENLPSFPNAAHLHICEPAFISQVIADADCDMLLDLAHARVSADILGYDIHDYLGRLPLGRVRELHLSGPRLFSQVDSRRQAIIWENAATVSGLLRFRDDNLVDAHEPLADEDYQLLEWTLEHTRPQAVSLEYFRDPGALRDQLLRLAAILGR